jgi:hypothetical protein
VICVLFGRYDLGEEEVLIYEYQVRCLFIFSSLRLECIYQKKGPHEAGAESKLAYGNGLH